MLANVDEQYAYLGTTGRVTGAEHEIEIWFASDGTSVTDAAERDTAARLLHAKYATHVSGSADEWAANAYLVALDPA